MSYPQATCRFFGDLIDLLTLPDEAGVVVRTFDESPSVKDQIEACGVPHTEVDLLLVNGVPVGFDHRIADGDRISVYPFFNEMDVSHMSLVRPEPLPEMRFLVDINLGKLARYLRLLGFDTLSDGRWHDAELVAIAVDQQRMLLTKDRPLLKRSAVTHGYLVRADVPLDQTIEVIRRFDMTSSIKPFGRCMECNGDLRTVEKADIDHVLEPLTRRYFDDFRQCVQCRRVFWKGSHHRRLAAVIEEVRARTT
ncbi:MAG: Mut7-C RNAse domain-containing protein [Acidimicrobiia bacterium]|nr:Mut7-C RNAse domain-containing protein [Acidimicrobiia bacterium]